MIRGVAEAFLAAVRAQTPAGRPAPTVSGDALDLSDVRIDGQIDIIGAIRSAIAAMRESSEAMEEAGAAYVAGSQHISVDGIWATMIDAALADR